jgi:hypothetical protein
MSTEITRMIERDMLHKQKCFNTTRKNNFPPSQFLFHFLYVIVIAFQFSCAQVRNVSGGEKDVVPPVVLMSEPEMLTTYFSENEFKITFDEFVSLNNASQELIVSPPLRKKPEVRLKGKTVEVKWDDELEPNTTYTFNFGDGVVDVHEGNVAKDLVYVFSTGSVIDSLSIMGIVTDAWTGNALAGIKVMLYRNMDTTQVYDSIPSFFTRSNADGSFIIPYLRDGAYQLVSLADSDSDYKLGDGEAFGFVPEPVSPSMNDSTAFVHQIRMSTMLPEEPDLRYYEVDSAGTLGFRWNKSFGDPTLRILGEPLKYSWQYIDDQDSIKLFLDGTPTDKYHDLEISWNNEVVDTLDIPFYQESLTSGSKILIVAKSQIVASQKIYFDSPDWQNLNAEIPVELIEDTLRITSRIVPDTNSINRFVLDARLAEGKTYHLTVLPGVFSNLSGVVNDTLVSSFRTYKEDDLGKIILQLKHGLPGRELILEISGPEGLVIRDTDLAGEVTLKYASIIPGEYTGRIYWDENGNNRWDPADYKNGKQPEQVWNLPQKMNIRGNWDVEVAWDLQE